MGKKRTPTNPTATGPTTVDLGDQPAAVVLELERAALDRWGRGDPAAFPEICADDVTYFDPFLDRRLDGLDALTRYYESLRGRVQVDRYELLNPRVTDLGVAAVLTFNYVSWADGVEHGWNCTEVYRRMSVGWRIVQTHWSRTRAR